MLEPGLSLKHTMSFFVELNMEDMVVRKCPAKCRNPAILNSETSLGQGRRPGNSAKQHGGQRVSKSLFTSRYKKPIFPGHLCVKGVNSAKDAVINFKHSAP